MSRVKITSIINYGKHKSFTVKLPDNTQLEIEAMVRHIDDEIKLTVTFPDRYIETILGEKCTQL